MQPHTSPDIVPLTPLLQSPAAAAAARGLSLSQMNRRIADGSVHTIEAGIGRPKSRIRASIHDTQQGLRALVISVEGAAELLEVSHDHVRRLIALGEIAAIDVGINRPKLRVRVSELERWVNSRDPRLVKGARHAE
jgi:excisionase family DNA binding protein